MVQNFFDQSFDVYTRRARLSPALITILPIALTVILFFPSELTLLGLLASLLVCGGGTALLAQLGRDSGRRKEAQLFARWDGKPTTRFLRHRNAQNSMILARRHRQLQDLLPDIRIPNTAAENADPIAADEIYDFCVKYLRDNTRDREKFHLIFEENCNYGFRRNLWGLKPYGTSFSALGLVIVITMVISYYRGWKSCNPTLAITLSVVNLMLFAIWTCRITPNWVKRAADIYANRLLDASEQIEVPLTKNTSLIIGNN
jgi:hypothetical protein